MSIARINSPISGKEMGQRFDQVINVINGYATSFSTDELFAPIIKGQDIITLTSDPTNSAGILVIAPDTFTYKDGNQDIHKIGYKDDIYYEIGDSITGYEIGAWGHLTSSKQSMYLSVPLNKKIPDNATIDITSLTAQIRGAGGTISVSSLSALDSLAINEDYTHGSIALVYMRSSSLFTAGTNNDCYEALLTLDFDVVTATS